MKKKYVLFATAALILAACSNDDENLNNEPVELRLSSGLGVETRATDVQNEQIANGETVYAWVDESDGIPYINAWELIAKGNGGFRGTTQYFPQSGNNVNIYAIHGNFGTTTFTENETDFPTTLTHTVSGTQTDAADVAKSDLLYAFAQNVSRNNGPTVNLTFNHRHFKDYSFLVDLQGQNMLMYNASQKKNPLIYGTVFASGTARIQGNGRLVDFDINLQSEPNTSVYLDFINNNRAGDYDFITFVDKSKLSPTSDSTAITPIDLANNPEEGAELRMNFMLDIDVNIVEGNYHFSLQQIIRKDFKIRDGSTISFQGDPFNANMHIDAIYNLTANIGDLDQSLANESVRASVPVNCVLNLDGPLRAPTFSFDLEFPNSNEELERQVRAFVDTEDMMTRQIVYLLVLNKFYTPEYAQTEYRSSELNAVASSAISTQLSSILNSLTDKVQIGTNIRAGQDGFRDDTEYEMLLSSQLLDNRLLINGNFGVRNTINTGRNNTFIGEFDLEYKLTPSGEIRLKAYNHARDMYFGLKQALTIQGVGIMYRKDFTHFSEIFRRKRKPLLPAPADSTGTAEAVKPSGPRT